MKWIISRYNHDLSYLPQYTKDAVLYDRSEEENLTYSQEISDCITSLFIVPNLGTDIYDKFKFIIDNYDNLPDVAVYTKANIFKYITPEEFDKIKDNKTFTPILTQNHKVYEDQDGPVAWYEDGVYCERNDYWYLGQHPTKSINNTQALKKLFGMETRTYNKFAPGSNYILTKENIRKHPKQFYKDLLPFLDYSVYPGEAQMIERNLYYIWNPES